MNLDRRVAAANLEGLVWVHRRRSATLGGVSTFSFGSSKYRRPQAIWPPRIPMIITLRSSRAVPSSLVPRQIHSPHSSSPKTAKRRSSARKSGMLSKS